jgi:hypothetical protein
MNSSDKIVIGIILSLLAISSSIALAVSAIYDNQHKVEVANLNAKLAAECLKIILLMNVIN